MVIGPMKAPTTPVPWLWIMKMPATIRMVIGMM
jgi:hypothetical protein